MPGGDALAQDDDGGAVDGGVVGDGVEVALEGEGEAGPIAEGFLLCEGPFEPSPAAVGGVGHVEDQHRGGWGGS